MVALSDARGAQALGDSAVPLTSSLPDGAATARTVADTPELHGLVRRAFRGDVEVVETLREATREAIGRLRRLGEPQTRE